MWGLLESIFNLIHLTFAPFSQRMLVFLILLKFMIIKDLFWLLHSLITFVYSSLLALSVLNFTPYHFPPLIFYSKLFFSFHSTTKYEQKQSGKHLHE